MIKLNFTSDLNKNPQIVKISELAESLQTEVFIVGGFVRDSILKREVSEIDLLVIGDGPSFAKRAAEKLNIESINIFKNFTCKFL